MSLHICRTCIQSIVLLPEATAMCRILSDKCNTSIRNDCSQNQYPDRQSNSIRNTNIKGTLEMNYKEHVRLYPPFLAPVMNSSFMKPAY